MATVFSVFRVVFAVTVGWYVSLLLAAGLAFGVLGDAGTFWVHTTLMGALALLSGPLLAYHVRNNPHEHDERGKWTGSELFFAIVFFITLFIYLELCCVCVHLRLTGTGVRGRIRRVNVESPEVRLVRVLFVCMGNICRSPLAQGVFENVARREGLDNEIFVDSAGTGNWHVGAQPDERAMKSARSRGLDISAQRARQISRDDCENFDYILTMDQENYRMVSSLCRGSSVVRPFLDFATGSPEWEVPDPYYGGPDGFEHVLDLVEEASEGLLEDIRERHLNDRG